MNLQVNGLNSYSKFITVRFKDDGFVPNSSLPAVVYRRALSFLDGADQDLIKSELEKLVSQNGWRVEWLWRIYKKPHYHSTAHETLAVLSGSAILILGGHRLGREITVSKGDVIVIPAGVAHQCIESQSGFQVFGLYPKDQKWDLLYGRKKERRKAIRNIRKTKSQRDPIYGKEGLLTELWK